MSGALRELIAFFGVEVDDKKLDHAGEKMENLAKLAEKAGATIGLAFGLHEIAEFIEGQIQMAVELGHTSEMLGLEVEDLQAFQYAAANAGLSADEANTSLRFLNKNIGAAAEGNKEAAEAFQKLGVHIKDANGEVRPTQEVFAEVAEGMSKLPSPAEKTAKAMAIFGRAGARLIPLLNKGGDGIEELYKEFEQLGGGITEDYVKVAEEAHHETLKLGVVWKGIKATIGGALIPAFGWLVSKIGDLVGWFREFSKHSYIVSTSLTVLGTIVAGLVVVWGVLNFEILLVVLAIALLILIVDDVYTAFKGGKSVIGDFIDSIWGVGTTEQVFVSLQNWAHKTWGYIELIAVAIGAAVNEAIELANEIGHTAHLISDDDYNLVKKEFERKKKEYVDKGDSAQFDIDNKAVRSIVEFQRDTTAGAKGRSPVNFQRDVPGTPAAAVTQAIAGGPPRVPAPGQAGGVTTVTNHNHTQIAVDVEAKGSSPKEIGKEVGRGVSDSFDDALRASFAGTPGNGGT